MDSNIITNTCEICSHELLHGKRFCSRSCYYEWRRIDTTEERFWSKVNKTDDCWLWTGKINATNYGQILSNGKYIKVHRYSWVLHYGEIPEIDGSDIRGTCVLHKCDTPACVNPDHLFIGTHSDNMRDMASKSRGMSLKGSEIGTSKLSDKDVLEIRSKYPSVMQSVLAEEYGVSQPVISKIVRRERWTHI